jgi:hypothetical protein
MAYIPNEPQGAPQRPMGAASDDGVCAAHPMSGEDMAEAVKEHGYSHCNAKRIIIVKYRFQHE